MNTKKILAAFLSAAMVLTSMAVPVFADDAVASAGSAGGGTGGSTPGTNTTTPANPEATMTFDDFVAKIENGESVGTETGRITVTWSPVSGCGITNNSHTVATCPLHLNGATASTPEKVNSSLAQFHVGKQATNITITNVDFKYIAKDFTFCHNDQSQQATGNKTVADAPTAQLYFLNNGDVTVSGCTFDNVVLTARNDQLKAEKKVSITGCEFNNVKNSYGIKEAHGSDITISNNKFNACRSGVMISGDKNKSTTVSTAKVNITDNEFNCIGDAQKGDLIQIAGDCNFDTTSTLKITNNKSTTDTPVLRLENKDIPTLDLKTNEFYETAPATSGESKFGATFKDGALDIQTWSDKNKNVNVKVGDNTYATLAEALTAVYISSPTDTVKIECRANADVGSMTHGHVADSITIEGNGAYVSAGERDLEFDTYHYDRTTGIQATEGTEGEYLTKDIIVTVNNLNGIAAWGERHTDKTVNLIFNNCKRMQRVYISGVTGTNNYTLNNCTFEGTDDPNARPTGKSSNTSIYSNAPGTIEVNSCTFDNVALGINLNNKSAGKQSVTVKDSKFINCATTENVNTKDWEAFSAPARFVTSGEGANSNVSVENCEFSYSEGKKQVGHGDILLGDGREKEKSTKNVTLTVSGTDATVKNEYPGRSEATQEHNVTKDSTSTIKMTGAAKIGESEYLTLTEALAKVKNGDTVTLLNNFTESITIPAEMSITLDLNGYTLRNVEGKHTIENYGTLTITDSSTAKTGKVDNVSNTKAALINYEGATATLNGGTFDRSKEAGSKELNSKTNKYDYKTGGNTYYTIRNYGAMTINEGVVANNNGVFTSLLSNGYYSPYKIEKNSENGKETKVPYFDGNKKADGTTAVTEPDPNRSLTINGGTFTGGKYIVKNDDYGKVIIKGGTFKKADQAPLLNWCDAEVTGGTFEKGSVGLAVYNGYSSKETGTGNLKISGGNFEGKIFVYGEKATTSISGGTFSEDVSKYCVDKHFASKNSDGKYEVKNIEDMDAPVTSLYKKDKKTTSYATGTNYTLINDYSDNDKIVLFYTLDGSNPTTSTKRKVYNGEKLKINNAVTVKTVYMKACGECENCRAGKYSECTDPGYGQIGTYKYTVKKKNSNADSSTGTSTRGVTYSGRTYTSDIFGVEHKSHDAYINGYADGTVKPDGKITREEIAAILYRVSNDASAIVASGNKFNDVSADRWSASAIECMARIGVINGYTDGSFKPSNNLTRAEFAALVSRFANLSNNGTNKIYNDIDASNWAYKYVMELSNAGYMNGYEDGSFRPESEITRAEVVTVINKIIGRNPSAEYVKTLSSGFSDLSSDAWYYTNVMEATTTHEYYLTNGIETKWENIK